VPDRSRGRRLASPGAGRRTPLRYFGPEATETWWDTGDDEAEDEMAQRLKPSGLAWD